MEKHTKSQNIIIILAFLVILIMPIVFINKVPNAVSVLENRVLAQFPNLMDQQGKVNDKYKEGFQNWLNDNIGFRQKIMDIHAVVSLDLLRTPPNKDVEIGRNGWFFLNQDHNMDIPGNKYVMTNEMLEKITQHQEALSQYYKSQGIDYVLILNPSSVSVYPEEIRSGSYKVDTTVIDEVAAYLRANSNVHVISTKDALVKAKQVEQVFLKTDTHWNYQGSYVGYCTIINQMKDWGIIDSDPVQVEWSPVQHQGDLPKIMGYANLLPLEQVKQSIIKYPHAQLIDSGPYFDQIQALKQKYNIQRYDISFTNPTAQKKNLLIYGDSMFYYFNVPQLFAENFSNTTYIWSTQMYNEITQIVKPDVVIMDFGERYLAALVDELTYENFRNGK